MQAPVALTLVTPEQYIQYCGNVTGYLCIVIYMSAAIITCYCMVYVHGAFVLEAPVVFAGSLLMHSCVGSFCL